MSIRVLLYTKDQIVSGGLKVLFEATPGFELADVVREQAELASKAKAACANVILLEMHPALTMAGIAELRRDLPSCPLVLWIQSIAVELAHQIVQLGVRGILRKDLPLDLMLRCLEKVAQGEVWYDRSLSDMLLRSREVTLSPRERQLMALISQGFSNKQVASTLMITEGTVKVYLSKLFKKVAVFDRFELALYGLRNLQYGPHPASGSEGAYAPASLIVMDRAEPRSIEGVI